MITTFTASTMVTYCRRLQLYHTVRTCHALHLPRTVKSAGKQVLQNVWPHVFRDTGRPPASMTCKQNKKQNIIYTFTKHFHTQHICMIKQQLMKWTYDIYIHLVIVKLLLLVGILLSIYYCIHIHLHLLSEWLHCKHEAELTFVFLNVFNESK